MQLDQYIGTALKSPAVSKRIFTASSLRWNRWLGFHHVSVFHIFLPPSLHLYPHRLFPSFSPSPFILFLKLGIIVNILISSLRREYIDLSLLRSLSPLCYLNRYHSILLSILDLPLFSLFENVILFLTCPLPCLPFHSPLNISGTVSFIV